MRLLLLLFLPACAVFSLGVAQGIGAHYLSGDWRSDGGARLLIGCAGSVTSTAYDLNQAAPDSGQMASPAHISAVDEAGFTVSHFPMASERYEVTQWPDSSLKGARMTAGGVRWTRNSDSDCQ